VQPFEVKQRVKETGVTIVARSMGDFVPSTYLFTNRKFDIFLFYFFLIVIE